MHHALLPFCSESRIHKEIYYSSLKEKQNMNKMYMRSKIYKYRTTLYQSRHDQQDFDKLLKSDLVAKKRPVSEQFFAQAYCL